MNRRPIVYISGPISDASDVRVMENLHRFAVVEHMLLTRGFAPINPACDSVAVGMGDVTYEILMEKDKALLSMSDVMYVLPGADSSPGSQIEQEEARHLDIPIVDNLSALEDLFTKWQDVAWVDNFSDNPDD